jgi:hypothetical protein
MNDLKTLIIVILFSFVAGMIVDRVLLRYLLQRNVTGIGRVIESSIIQSDVEALLDFSKNLSNTLEEMQNLMAELIDKCEIAKDLESSS